MANDADTARQVACEDAQGLLNVHPANEYCAICAPCGPSAIDVLRAESARFAALGRAATPGKWLWWTSCSYRRLMAEDKCIAYGYRCSDGVIDIVISEQDRALSEAAPDLVKHIATLQATIDLLMGTPVVTRETLAGAPL